MRLDKFLANLKYGSRSEIKKILKSNLVKVNDEIVRDGSIHIDELNDIIFINGIRVNYQKYHYLMMNKPEGYISATFDNYHKTVIDLLDEKVRLLNVYPCGRLDIDTEGLLILSNDGNFAHKITHPKKEIYKKYYVEVDKSIYEDDIIAFQNGLNILDGNNKPYQTKKAKLEKITNTCCYVYISEGKFHQIKRMFMKLDKKVLYLKRVQIGKLKLDDSLKLGQYKELNENDIELLFQNESKMEEF
ncbi:MAG TPA: pseudouridine synthase [Haloplasmataceae bacterium]